MTSPIGPEARTIQTRNDPWPSPRAVPFLLLLSAVPAAASASSSPPVVLTLTPAPPDFAGAEVGGDARSWAVAGEPCPNNRTTPMTPSTTSPANGSDPHSHRDQNDINNPATTGLQHCNAGLLPLISLSHRDGPNNGQSC